MTDTAKSADPSIDAEIKDISFQFDDSRQAATIVLPLAEYNQLKDILQKLDAGNFDWEMLFKMMREVSMLAYRHFHKKKKGVNP